LDEERRTARFARSSPYNCAMRMSRLAVEIAALLVLKAALLFALWSLFFAHRPAIDAQAVDAHLTRSP
jgi:hypothetical protein